MSLNKKELGKATKFANSNRPPVNRFPNKRQDPVKLLQQIAFGEPPMFEHGGTHPTPEERAQATLDYLNTHPYQGMPKWDKLNEVSTTNYPAMKSSGLFIPHVGASNIKAYDPEDPQSMAYKAATDYPEDYIGYNVNYLSGKTGSKKGEFDYPMVFPSEAELEGLNRSDQNRIKKEYKEFNKQNLHLYKDPRFLGKDVYYHVYGRGEPYNPALQEEYYKTYPSMNPNPPTAQIQQRFGGQPNNHFDGPPNHPMTETVDTAKESDSNLSFQDEYTQLHTKGVFEQPALSTYESAIETFGQPRQGYQYVMNPDTRRFENITIPGNTQGYRPNFMGWRKIQNQFWEDAKKADPRELGSFQEGGIIKQGGWEYQKVGENYLTRRQGNTNWITAKGKALNAIKEKIYGIDSSAPQSGPVVDPVQQQQIKTELKNYDLSQTGNKEYVENIQRKLVNAGYDLGRYGPNRDGVDGIFGNATKNALEAFNSGISPEYAPVPSRTRKKTREPKIEKFSGFEVSKDLKPGILPTLGMGSGEESCIEGQGCSYNVSVKMGNLLGNVTDAGAGALWADDAWFNLSNQIQKGGDLIYKTDERNVALMPKVPKDAYQYLQVGDYVQLNRKNTNSSYKYAAKRKEGLQNENVEHLGFIIGKDDDGTPLVWHGSESGNAYIQRIDEDIYLPDHAELGNYQVASIVRNADLANADPEKLKALQESAYYSPVDEGNKLIPTKNATYKEKQMANVVNDSIEDFKKLGYAQDDLTYIGQILVGGIMENESSGDESLKRAPKQLIATMLKDVAGFGSTEASKGIYQLKPEMNFKDKQGNLNKIGKQLESLGYDFSDLNHSSEAQTIGGLLMLLDAYSDLKNDPNYDASSNLYMGKVPASYILAKSWQAGKGWHKRDKYKHLLDNLDVDYSWNALENAVNNITVGNADKNLKDEYNAAAKRRNDQISMQEEWAARRRAKEEQAKKENEAYLDRNLGYDWRYERDFTNAAESTGRNVYQPEDPFSSSNIGKKIQYKQYGGVPKLDAGGHPHPHSKYNRYVSYGDLMQDWRSQANNPNERGDLFYRGYNNAVGDYSSLHPTVRSLVDLDYLEDRVTQANRTSGIYGGSGDNAYEKKAMMGEVPVQFDEQGNAMILGDEYGGRLRSGRQRKSVDYHPINYKDYFYDQLEGTKQKFLPATEVEAEAEGYVKKLHRMPEDKRRAIVDRMETIKKMVAEQQGKNVWDEDFQVDREQLYNLATSNKEVISDADEYSAAQQQMIEDRFGTIKQGKPQKELTTWDKVKDVASDPFAFFQASMGTGNASDLWSSGQSLRDQKEMYKQAGEDFTIHGRPQSAVGDLLNTWNPARFASDTGYNLDAERYGDIGLDVLSIAAPSIAKYTGKGAKYLMKKAAPYYNKLFNSTKYLNKYVTDPLINKSQIYTKYSPRTKSALQSVTRLPTIDNMAIAKAGIMFPSYYDKWDKDPTTENLIGMGIGATGFLGAPKYAKNILGSAYRYADDVVGASRHAGKFTLPKYQNVYRVEHAGFNQAASADDITGRWFLRDPEKAPPGLGQGDLDFYNYNLKIPGTNQVVKPFSATSPQPVRIMSARVPQHKAEKMFGAGMPEEARLMSYGTGNLSRRDYDQYFGPGGYDRFASGSLSSEDVFGQQTLPFVFNPKEGILDASFVNKARESAPNVFSLGRYKSKVVPSQGQGDEFIRKIVYPNVSTSGRGIGQYFPHSYRFRQGGLVTQGKFRRF